MAQKPATLRRTIKSSLIPRNRRAAPQRKSRTDADDEQLRDAKVIRRYVAWLLAAPPKQRQIFIERFCRGLQALPPCEGVQTLMILKLLGYGPVSAAHAAECNPNLPCATCERVTSKVELTNDVCCHRGIDNHSVVFN
jgi:hypothetical protein